MNFAINYSPQAADLSKQGEIEIDLFKCPDWPELIEEASALAPVYVHFPLVAGHPSLYKTDWRNVERVLEQTNTPFVNVHLEVITEVYPQMAVNTADPHDSERITERLIDDIRYIAEHVGAERVIAENIIYRGHRRNVLRPCVQPEVIRTVIEETDCGFLLDLSHARISAHYLGVEEAGVDVWSYLEGLPLERLKELHLTGIHFHEGKLSDHLPLTDFDWEMTERIFGAIRAGVWGEPQTVSFEYGGLGPIFAWRSRKEVIAEQVPRLYGLVHADSDSQNAPTTETKAS